MQSIGKENGRGAGRSASAPSGVGPWNRPFSAAVRPIVLRRLVLLRWLFLLLGFLLPWPFLLLFLLELLLFLVVFALQLFELLLLSLLGLLLSAIVSILLLNLLLLLDLFLLDSLALLILFRTELLVLLLVLLIELRVRRSHVIWIVRPDCRRTVIVRLRVAGVCRGIVCRAGLIPGVHGRLADIV